MVWKWLQLFNFTVTAPSIQNYSAAMITGICAGSCTGITLVPVIPVYNTHGRQQ